MALNFLKKGVVQESAKSAIASANVKAKIAAQTEDEVQVKPATSGLKFLKTGAATQSKLSPPKKLAPPHSKPKPTKCGGSGWSQTPTPR